MNTLLIKYLSCVPGLALVALVAFAGGCGQTGGTHVKYIATNEIQQSGAQAATTKPAASQSPQFMFVQVAEDVKVDTAAKTVRLVKVNQQTLYFSDRPQRIAGHLTMADYLKEWTTQAGKDNFAKTPPNATLSVYEQGQPDNTIVVIEITKPVIDGADITYNYRVINGTMPASGGATALFIDWIGVGGGVGRGFHGVGVGRRGPGFAGW